MHRSLKLVLVTATVLSSIVALAGAASASPATPAAVPGSTVYSFVRPGPHVLPPAPAATLAVGGWYTMNFHGYLITLDRNGWKRVYWIGDCVEVEQEDGGAVCYDLWYGNNYIKTTSLGGRVFSSICVGLNSNNREEVFAKALGGDAVHIWQVSDNTSDWGSWQSLGGLIANNYGVECPDVDAPYYQPSDGLLRIRVFGPDGMYHYKRQLTPHGDWTSYWY